MTTPQVTIKDLEKINSNFKALFAHGKAVNQTIEAVEKNYTALAQAGQESGGVVIGLMIYLAAVAVANLVDHFMGQNKDFIDLMKKYADTTLKQLGAVNAEKFGKQKIKGYKFDRFMQIGKALVSIGTFVDQNISKTEKEEVIWNEKLFPNMRIVVIGNDLHAPGDSVLNPGWEKGSLTELGWTSEKLGQVVQMTKAILLLNNKFAQNTVHVLHEVAASAHDEKRSAARLQDDDQRHEGEKHLAIVRKNFYNFRAAIQIYMYFSHHFLAEFFSVCRKAQKSIAR